MLDLTYCTGLQLFFLNNLGYEVVVADFSPVLLEIARKKAKTINKNIKFIDGDMQELRVGKFDSVITIFNAIGYLTEQDFEQALKKNLCKSKRWRCICF